MTQRNRRITCGVLLVSQLLAGCSRWSVVSVSPQILVETEHPQTLKIWEKGGNRFLLDAPRVSGDSLSGTMTRDNIFYPNHSVPLAAIDYVQVKKTDIGKSVLLGVGVFTLVAGAVFVMGTRDMFNDLNRTCWLCDLR
jgi:hypothetical protein